MPRTARIVLEGAPHHITQRGNYRQDVFKDDEDRFKYLFWVNQYAREFGVSILAYCLMPNHVHFIAIPADETSFANAFKLTHMRYAQYFNLKNKISGHLWQGRYYSCALDQPHFLCALRYVELNPVRAQLAKNPWDWRWSSTLSHLAEENDYLRVNEVFDYVDFQQYSWKEFLLSGCEGEDLEDIRKATISGRPLGSECFVREIENTAGRKLTDRK